MPSQPNREREIFNAALDLTSAEARNAYLRDECAEDVEMRARVETLLRAHDRANGFLPADDSEPQVEASAKTISIAMGMVAVTEKPGDRIGRYKLREKIGEGGCGVVYVAEQEEPVRRRVALKVIKLGMDTKSVIARFGAERQALAMMDHPNIAKVLDAGATDTGRPYFVMELVRGIKITDYCDQYNLPTRERLDLFIKVCQAIQHAHQKGIIHRDLKPSNILVTLHDGVPVPKIIDFGIAKATEGRLTDLTVYTELHQFMGTPAYMSPEQAEMSGLDIDTRSDIYSLGVLLYELLTGGTPFNTKELIESGLDAMRKTIRETEPLRPSTRLSTMLHADLTAVAKHHRAEPPKLVHLIRGDLDWIVMKSLEKDRARRYDTANGLAADIRRHLGNEPVVARPPSAAYRFQKAFRRNKLLFTAGGAVGLALMFGLVAASWQALRATKAETEQAKLRALAVHAKTLAEEAATSEATQRRRTEEARSNEAQLRHQAQVQELAARQRAYASDMNLAQQSLGLNNLGRALELLNRHTPSVLAGDSASSTNLGTRADRGSETDLRGWEWRYLWKQCQSDALFTLCESSNGINSLSVSWDGKWLAVGAYRNGQLTIWDLRTKRQLTSLPAGDGHVLAVFSPRESLLACSIETNSGATNGQHFIRLWNGETRQVMTNLSLGSRCLALAVSGDGRKLVTSTADPDWQVTVWQLPEGTKLGVYPASRSGEPEGTPLAVARDLSVAADPTEDNKVRVWDAATGRERWKAKATDELVLSLALSPDEKLLASGDGWASSSIRLWEVASGKEIGRLEGHRAWIAALVFWPDGKTLASASGDQTIRLWDVTDPAKGRLLSVLLGHKFEVWRLALLPDNTTLVSGSKDGSVNFWDTATIRRERKPITLPTSVAAWRFTPDSQSILTVSRQGRVTQWQGSDFQRTEVLLEVGTNFAQTCFSEDGRWLAGGSTNGHVRVWDLHSRTPFREFTAHTGPVLPWKFMGEGQELMLLHVYDGSVHEWDLKRREETRSWRGPPLFFGEFYVLPLCGRALSRDERSCLMLGGRLGSSLIDLASGHERKLSLEKYDAVSFSPDGRLFAGANIEGDAKLWDTATGQEVASLRGVLLAMVSVAFSPDGKRLAIGSAGKEAVKLWDVESHQELLTLEGQGSDFMSSAFSPDGNIVGSMNDRGLLHLWRAPPWDEIEAAEAKVRKEERGGALQP